ncbi:MAG: PDZ domain-containing protein [Acidobacteria bacterium]|nr:PDZ domain-containing protein [Acidobacteriota bacterium]
MSLKGKLIIVALSTAIAFYAVVGGFLSVHKDVFAKGDPYVQMRIFGEVLRHIVRDYVDEPDLEKVKVGALRGLAEGLDPYSAYLSPEQAKKYNSSRSELATTGMILSRYSGYIYVLAVVKDSPAEKVGLRAGDIIEYIDTLPTRDISLYDAEELLSGQTGSEIEIKVFRRGRPYKTKIKRAVVSQPAIEISTIETGIGYLKITSLADGKAEEVKKQLADLQKKGVQKLILDLRGAANGSLETGVEIANLFVKSGTLAKSLGHKNIVEKTFEADPSKAIFTGQLALVIDRSTASAGEVIAAAILNNKRGELVGEKTFGAGSVQKLFELKGGSAMLITTSKYADSTGVPFMRENSGITPSVEVKNANVVANDDSLPEDNDQQNDQVKTEDPQLPIEAAGEDLQLKKAIEVLKGNQAEKRSAQVDQPNKQTEEKPAKSKSAGAGF